MVEFGAELSFTYVMGGLARDYARDAGSYIWLVSHGDHGYLRVLTGHLWELA